VPHIFINSSSHDSARHWTPCLDNLWDRCPWELEIAVPRYLKQESDEVEDQLGSEDDIEDGELVRVIASAELEEQVRSQSVLKSGSTLTDWASTR